MAIFSYGLFQIIVNINSHEPEVIINFVKLSTHESKYKYSDTFE